MTVKRTGQLLLFFICALLAFSTATAGAQEEKIAVAANGDNTDTLISQKTARAPFILIFDKNGNLVESHKNPTIRDRRAGPAMAQWLAENHVDIIIGGNFGARMTQALEDLQIRRIKKSGSVIAAVKDVLE
ncbi:MAG: NifB/NifX family molybdenum-iron cluster-binding protein [Thermodesulfobacteriota bacterium]